MRIETQPQATRTPQSPQTLPGQAASFDPLLQHIAEQQRQVQAAQQVAGANRRAQAQQRVSESDLRRADDELQRRHDPGTTAEMLDQKRAAGQATSASPARPPSTTAAHARRRATTPRPPTTAAPEVAGTLVAHVHNASGSSALSAPAGPTRAVVASVSGGSAPAVRPAAPTGAIARSAPASGTAALQVASAGRGGGESASGSSTQSQAGLDGRADALREPARQASKMTAERGMTPTASRRMVSDVLKVLQARRGPGRSLVKLQLSPPELGRLTIDMRMDRETMTVRIAADSGAVRDLLQAHATSMTEALQELGLRVERFDVEFVEPQDVTPDAGGDGHDPTEQTPADPRQSGGPQLEAHAEDDGSDGNSLESRLEAELPADVFIPGHVDITA